ncbi:MAG TPA: NAD(P)H-binding protein [Candidatus Thermoplasmatota archaeon]|nr:NAD(P)H-binding protein [Candidatus Thermoplasmatota archaeon]
MRVFVTGGTGFVGRAVVEELLRHGHDVTCLVHERPPPARPRLSTTRGSVADAASLRMEAHDAVVHLVGILRETRGRTFEAAHVDATRNVVAAARRDGVRRFLHMSANGARLGGTGYQDTKARAEESVRGSGLDWTVFRPSFIAGEGPGFDDQWRRIARMGPLPRFGKGEFEMQPVALSDVALAFARALERPQSIGKVYALGGPERFTFAEYERRLLRQMDVKRPVVPVPKPVARSGAALLQWIPGFPADPEALTMLFEGNVTDDDAWTRDLDIRPKTWEEATTFLRRRP